MSMIDSTIIGVEIKTLKTHRDDRGFFREVIRVTDPFFGNGGFAQWSHSRMVKDTVKAWHYHHVQYDWWDVPMGVVRTVLIDNRTESPTLGTRMEFFMGDSTVDPQAHEICVRIPPGVLHGCRVLTSDAHLFYITSETYATTDEGRIPFDAPEIGYPWGPNPIVVPNDTKYFAPTAPRKVLAR